MTSQQPAVLISNIELREGQEEAFTEWKAFHDREIAKIEGFLSCDVIAPNTSAGRRWVLIANFDSREALDRWRESEGRGEVVAKGLPLFEGGDLGEVVQAGEETATQGVTEVIFSRIRPGCEEQYRAWTARIQSAQAKSPGYRGMFLQPGKGPGDFWTTILRFENAVALENWLGSSERRELLEEASHLVEHERQMRLSTSFPGWVPVDPVTGEGPPNWKTALLVLLGLFPMVLLTLRFINPILSEFLVTSPATFVGNMLTVAGTTFISMPLFVRWFGWWLFPGEHPRRNTLLGLGLLLVLFGLEIALLQLLFL